MWCDIWLVEIYLSWRLMLTATSCRITWHFLSSLMKVVTSKREVSGHCHASTQSVCRVRLWLLPIKSEARIASNWYHILYPSRSICTVYKLMVGEHACWTGKNGTVASIGFVQNETTKLMKRNSLCVLIQFYKWWGFPLQIFWHYGGQCFILMGVILVLYYTPQNYIKSSRWYRRNKSWWYFECCIREESTGIIK